MNSSSPEVSFLFSQSVQNGTSHEDAFDGQMEDFAACSSHVHDAFYHIRWDDTCPDCGTTDLFCHCRGDFCITVPDLSNQLNPSSLRPSSPPPPANPAVGQPNRDEAGPLNRQEMESHSIGSGALVASSAPPPPPHSLHFHAQSGAITFPEDLHDGPEDGVVLSIPDSTAPPLQLLEPPEAIATMPQPFEPEMTGVGVSRTLEKISNNRDSQTPAVDSPSTAALPEPSASSTAAVPGPPAESNIPDATPSLPSNVPDAAFSTSSAIPDPERSLASNMPDPAPSLTYNIPDPAPTVSSAILNPEPSLSSNIPDPAPSLAYNITDAEPALPYNITDAESSAPFNIPAAEPALPFNVPDTGFSQDPTAPLEDIPYDQFPLYTPAEQAEPPDPDQAKAYAKLVFSDGDLYITTHDVVLGRNMERFDQIRQRKKQERRAQEELATYRKEPSQPSQPGDGDQQAEASSSSLSLEGRPAPPSNFSEHGGPVWYPPHSENGVEIPRVRTIRRRVSHFSKSSSTTSVAPASLHAHPTLDGLDQYGEPQKRTSAFIPIHTEIAEDIVKISKEHLMFSYNFPMEQWELKIIGNRAFVNEELFERGTVIPLEHNDEIIIASVTMRFKLPDGFRASSGFSQGTFSRHSEDEELSEEGSGAAQTGISTSPIRRLSNAIDVEEDDSEDDEDDEDVPDPKGKRPKLKLKAKPDKKKTKAIKTTVKETLQKEKGKKAVKRESSSEPSPPPTDKKAGKGKKPKAAAKGEAEGSKDAAPPPAAPFVQPGSVLEGIPVEDLPEKRKGPGRPPKEGNVSKRDTQLANKKKKEYEKRGEEPPPFKDLVNMVRQESKLKEMQAKAEASGQIEPGQQIRPSIEVDGIGQAAPIAAKDGADVGESHESAKRSSPKPKRQIREISPVKPESECTAEELKKPDHTYVHIIDQVLSEHHTGIADLQEIYELIMKKYPYFKYKQATTGWQSSVRHNLLSAPRFKDVGKSGKGKLWTIDHDNPLEKEKRKKTPPPKMGNGAYPMGQMQPGQYGAYGDQRQNGQLPPGAQPGAYYSPYGQPGYASGSRQQMGYGQGQQPMYGSQMPNGTPAPPPQPTPWDNLVKEIIQFNARHLAAFPNESAEQQRQSDILTAITEFLSECYSGKMPDDAKADKVRVSDARVEFGGLSEIFRRYQPEIRIPDPWSGVPIDVQWAAAAPAPTPAPAANGGSGSGANAATSQTQAGTNLPAHTNAPAGPSNDAPPPVNGTPHAAMPPYTTGSKRPANGIGDEQGEHESKRMRNE